MNLVSREIINTRWDIELLIKYGLDPLVYKAEYWNDYSGGISVIESWWGTTPYIIKDGVLSCTGEFPKGICRKGQAASPTYVYQNYMF